MLKIRKTNESDLYDVLHVEENAFGNEKGPEIADAHANAWMVQELRSGVIGGVRGKVICADVLNQPEHWRE